MGNLLPYIFAAITLIGVLYFLYSLFFGADGADSLDIGDTLGDASGDGEFTMLLAASFASIFGAIGLLGTLSQWNLLVTLVVAIVAGLAIGRGVMTLLRFVRRQESTHVDNVERLIGSSGRVTIDSPAGAVSEAMLEGEYVHKYAIREVNSAQLQRGDVVEVVDVDNSLLYVKKKRV